MYFKQVNVMWIGRLQYEPNFFLASHKHDFFQLFYILDGAGSMSDDYRQYRLRGDQIFFSPPGNYHSLCCDRKSPMRTIEIKFNIKNNDLYDDLKNISGCMNADNSEIRRKLENLVGEASNKDTLSRDVINSEVFLILLKMLRRMNQNKPDEIVFLDTSSADYSGASKVFSAMFEYIHKNLRAPICLEELANRVGYDPNYLGRIFKKEFGITPMKYINDLKHKKAKELLENSGMTVTEISDALGFHSIHYFSKCFKERENVTPLEFRKNIRYNFNMKLDEEFDNGTQVGGRLDRLEERGDNKDN